MMGPFATQILGDQGADVIMVEEASGDTNRVMGEGPHPQFSGLSLNLLRNKRSVALDLKSDDGKEAVRQLIGTCDVMVATLRPKALLRLGLDYESVQAIRPDIIYCQAQGFPLDSNRANDPAYDDIIQAATGVCDVMERVFGAPALMPTIFADKTCGVVSAQAVCAALFHRERTGLGQHIEVPMAQTMAAFMLAEHGGVAISMSGDSEGEMAAGYPRVLSPERRPHPTQDGMIHMLPYLPKHYASLFASVDPASTDDDARYASMKACIANSDELYREVRAACATRTTDEWLVFCAREGIPVTRVVTLREMVDSLPVANHPVVGDFRLIDQLANFYLTPGRFRLAAPMVGEHTDEVLDELALGSDAAVHVDVVDPS